MQTWIVRTNCEYSQAVSLPDGATEDEAVAAATAAHPDVATWDQAWAPMEAGQDDHDPARRTCSCGTAWASEPGHDDTVGFRADTPRAQHPLRGDADLPHPPRRGLTTP
jgi:hypothetical protein